MVHHRVKSYIFPKNYKRLNQQQRSESILRFEKIIPIHATIPSNVFPSFFTQAASDNGDYSQESNSQHVTNTVLYQYGNFNPVRPVRVTNTQSKISFKRRSLSLPHLPLEEANILRKPDLPNYFSDIRIKYIFSVEKSSEWTYSSLIASLETNCSQFIIRKFQHGLVSEKW